MLFQLRNISKSFNKKKVFTSLSLTLEEGEFVALIGKNGEGKSTLMRCLAQAEGLDEGMCYYRGNSFDELSQNSMAEVFFLHENFFLPSTKTIAEWAKWIKSISETFEQSVYQKLIRSLHVDDSQYFQQLSRGQAMKAIFALFAARRPKVYLIDEVTSVLDSGSRFAFIEFLKAEVGKGCTVILSTNIASEMIGYASRIIVLSHKGIGFDSKVGDLHESFVKIRLQRTNEDGLRELEARGGHRLRLNNDDFWSVLIGREKCPSGFTQDAREITIEDVAVYFTSDGERS